MQNIKVLNKKPIDKNNRNQNRVFHKTVNTPYEAVMEILSIPGYIDDIFADEIKRMSIDPESEDYDEVTLLDLAYKMGDEFLRNVPDIITGNSKFWQYSCSIDKVFLKTDKYVGFGWVINKETKPNEDGGFNIKSIQLTFSSYNSVRTIDEINYLNENGWILQQIKEK